MTTFGLGAQYVLRARRRLALGACAAAAFTVAGCASGPEAPSAPPDIGSTKQLFIDWQMVEHASGISLTVDPPQKTGEASISRTKPWESGGIKWASVIQEGDQLKMWYEAHLEPASRWKTQLMYATSVDGVNWSKPELGRFTHGGSTATNIVFHGRGDWISGSCVFRDPGAPLHERYKMVFGDRYGDPNHTTAGAHSANGIDWIPYGEPRLIPQGTDTQNVAFLDRRLARFVLYTRLNFDASGTAGRRQVGRADSATFAGFPRAASVMRADPGDPPNTGFYNSAVLQYPYAGDDVYFAFPTLLNERDPSQPMNIQLAVSRDGVNWTRPARQPFLSVGAPGAFDSGMVFMSVGIARFGDELSMYYSGYPVTHDQVGPQAANDARISRVRLRLDGFVSAQAGAAGGEILTVPFTFAGSRLHVNVDPGSAGSLSVAVLDAAGAPLTGFAHEDMRAIVTDGVDHEVSWRNGPDLKSLMGKTIRLQFRLHSARLYAFQFRNP